MVLSINNFVKNSFLTLRNFDKIKKIKKLNNSKTNLRSGYDWSLKNLIGAKVFILSSYFQVIPKAFI